MFLPQLTSFFQTKIRQIDHSRYTALSLVCVCSVTKLTEDLHREKRMEMDIFGAPSELVPATPTASECLESQQHRLLVSSSTLWRKLLAKDSHTCKDNQVLTDCNPEETSLPQCVLTGSALRLPHPKFTSQRGQPGATSLRRAWLYCFFCSFKHLWNRSNFCVLHCL